MNKQQPLTGVREQPGSALQAGTSNALEVVQTGNLTELLVPCRPGGNGVMKDKSYHQQIPLMNFKGLKLSLK